MSSDPSLFYVDWKFLFLDTKSPTIEGYPYPGNWGKEVKSSKNLLYDLFCLALERRDYEYIRALLTGYVYPGATFVNYWEPPRPKKIQFIPGTKKTYFSHIQNSCASDPEFRALKTHFSSEWSVDGFFFAIFTPKVIIEVCPRSVIVEQFIKKCTRGNGESLKLLQKTFNIKAEEIPRRILAEMVTLVRTEPYDYNRPVRKQALFWMLDFMHSSKLKLCNLCMEPFVPPQIYVPSIPTEECEVCALV